MVQLNDLKQKIYIKLSHIRAKYQLTRDFKNMNFTKDNLIIFYNYLLTLGYNKASDYLVQPIKSRPGYIWFVLENPEIDRSRVKIDIHFYMISNTIDMEITKFYREDKLTHNNQIKRISYKFEDEINLNSISNYTINTNEARDFLSETLSFIKSSFLYSIENVKW